MVTCPVWASSFQGVLGSGVSATPVPSFNGLIKQFSYTSSGASFDFNPDSDISSGTKIIIGISYSSTTQTVTGASDTKSNTYSITEEYYRYGDSQLCIVSIVGNITSTLSSSDTITIDLGSPTYSSKVVGVLSFANISNEIPYVSNYASTYSTELTALSLTVTNDPSVVASFFLSITSDKAYSGGTFTYGIIGPDTSYGFHYAVKSTSSSGSYSPDGSYSTICTWGGIICALK